MNRECGTDSGDTILSNNYNQKDSATYCNGAVGSGTLNLSTMDIPYLELSATDEASSTSNSLCEWEILTDNTMKVTIIIKQDINVYSNIVISQYSGDDNQILTSKEIATWERKDFEAEYLENDKLIIRAMIFERRIWLFNQGIQKSQLIIKSHFLKLQLTFKIRNIRSAFFENLIDFRSTNLIKTLKNRLVNLKVGKDW